MRHTRPETGFTLVELLVVTGIVAVLLGILLTSLGQARALSRRTRCLANLREIAAANAGYAAEFPGWNVPAHWGWSPAAPPWPANTPPPAPPSGPRRYWYQVWQFEQSLGAPRPSNARYSEGMVCPDATVAFDRADANGYSLQYSYGMNRTQMPGTSDIADAPDYWNAWKISQVQCPAEKIQFVDGVGATVSASGSFNSTLRYFVPGYGERHEAPNKTSIVAYRHRRGANVLFHDGHAQWLPIESLRYDPADTMSTQNKRQWEPTRR